MKKQTRQVKPHYSNWAGKLFSEMNANELKESLQELKNEVKQNYFFRESITYQKKQKATIEYIEKLITNK